MTCGGVKENLGAFLYDELDGKRRREMEEHVGVCANCRAELHAEQRLQRALAERMRDFSKEVRP
jgi:anti-sigma factor RsiW